MKWFMKYRLIIVFSFMGLMIMFFFPTSQKKVSPVSMTEEVSIATPAIADTAVFAKFKRDWEWNNALGRARLAMGEPIESFRQFEDVVNFNGVDHTIDVTGVTYPDGGFTCIIDLDIPSEVWVTARPGKELEIDVLSPDISFTLVGADMETKKTALAVLALWER